MLKYITFFFLKFIKKLLFIYLFLQRDLLYLIFIYYTIPA